MNIDLRKQKVIDLKKSNKIEDVIAQVSLHVDYSGSMSYLYKSGLVQRVVERILPVGLGFDDNGEIEIFKFHTECHRVMPNVNEKNYNGYVDKYIKGEMGGTYYSPIIIEAMKSALGTIPVTFTVKEPSKNILSSLGKFFKSKSEDNKPTNNINTIGKVPYYAIVVTDGDCHPIDRAKTIQALIEASKYGIFFQFIGIGSADFSFLEQLDTMEGRYIDNANFFAIENIDKISDDELYSSLMAEFSGWIGLAKSKNVI